MKIIIAGMLGCLVIQAAYFAIRDAASATVPGFDRFAEFLIFLMFVTLIFYARHPRMMLILSAICAAGIGFNLERHTDDHSLSGILARNLLLIAFFIIGGLGASRGRVDSSKLGSL
jgi:hypothetical protein